MVVIKRKLNSSLFSLDILSLDLVQVIKLLSIFITSHYFRLSNWLSIVNPVHNECLWAIEMGALFNLAKMLVLVPYKKQNCQVKMAKYKKVGDQATEDQKQI